MDAIFTAPRNSQKQRQTFVIRPTMTWGGNMPFPHIAERFKLSCPESKTRRNPLDPLSINLKRI